MGVTQLSACHRAQIASLRAVSGSAVKVFPPCCSLVNSVVEQLAEETRGRAHFIVKEHGQGVFLSVKSGPKLQRRTRERGSGSGFTSPLEERQYSLPFPMGRSARSSSGGDCHNEHQLALRTPENYSNV